MKWKNKIWIVDDIIPKQQQEAIKNALLGSQFPWHFMPDITGGGSRDARPGFSHGFIKDGVIGTHQAYMKMLEPLWEGCFKEMKKRTRVKGNYSIVKSRTFLQLPLRNTVGGEYDAHHIDLPEEHFALLYYVCNSDGQTVLFENMFSPDNRDVPEPDELKEKVRVSPKQGRAVIFDGYHWHTATQPTRGVRCIINSDIVQLP